MKYLILFLLAQPVFASCEYPLVVKTNDKIMVHSLANKLVIITYRERTDGIDTKLSGVTADKRQEVAIAFGQLPLAEALWVNVEAFKEAGDCYDSMLVSNVYRSLAFHGFIDIVRCRESLGKYYATFAKEF